MFGREHSGKRHLDGSDDLHPRAKGAESRNRGAADEPAGIAQRGAQCLHCLPLHLGTIVDRLTACEIKQSSHAKR